ncbi:MAG: hypothetical protein J0I32_21765 [Sphingobacteriales bacterium]|nr:hypothetical protein [Sphingobacteriales bacterium]OJW03372.1 MAG: hypothetical protein BGO52_23715 [Sphingobacteriales bacterium 44-61]
MGFALIRYSGQEFRVFQELEDRVIEKNLTHYASWLLGRGLSSQDELEEALNKAMNALGSARLACYRHFKKIYISQRGQLKPDWLVSDLGMRMIIMHTDAGNPAMASLQVQVLTEMK